MNSVFTYQPPHMGKEQKYFIDAYDSLGCTFRPSVDAFEQEMVDYLAMKNSCVIIRIRSFALIIENFRITQGDIVLCPSLTFAASANVVLIEKAQPIFIDSNPNAWLIDLVACEKQCKSISQRHLYLLTCIAIAVIMMLS